MNGKKLMEGLSYIDERYIAEAEEAIFPKRNAWTRPAASLTACAAAVALVLLGVGPDSAPESICGDDADPGESVHSAISETVLTIHTQASESLGTVRVRVEEGGGGTYAVVVESAESDAIPLGKDLTLVLEENKQNPETSVVSGSSAMDIDVEKGKEEPQYLTVRVLSYDPETGVLRGEIVPGYEKGD